jgi:hypothetical protein
MAEFDIRDQPVISFSEFVRYWRKYRNMMEMVCELFKDFKEVGDNYCTVFSLSTEYP